MNIMKQDSIPGPRGPRVLGVDPAALRAHPDLAAARRRTEAIIAEHRPRPASLGERVRELSPEQRARLLAQADQLIARIRALRAADAAGRAVAASRPVEGVLAQAEALIAEVGLLDAEAAASTAPPPVGYVTVPLAKVPQTVRKAASEAVRSASARLRRESGARKPEPVVEFFRRARPDQEPDFLDRPGLGGLHDRNKPWQIRLRADVSLDEVGRLAWHETAHAFHPDWPEARVDAWTTRYRFH